MLVISSAGGRKLKNNIEIRVEEFRKGKASPDQAGRGALRPMAEHLKGDYGTSADFFYLARNLSTPQCLQTTPDVVLRSHSFAKTEHLRHPVDCTSLWLAS